MFSREAAFVWSQRLFPIALTISAAALTADLAIRDCWQPRIWYILGLAVIAMPVFVYRARQIGPWVEALTEAQAISTTRWLLLCDLFYAVGQPCIAAAIIQGPAAQIDELVTAGGFLQTLAVVWADTRKLITSAHQRWKEG